MAEKNIIKLMADVLLKTNKDYIVEQGISGFWTYRKWNSGLAECIMKWIGTSKAYVDLGSGDRLRYGHSAEWAFPFLFIDTPVVVSDGRVGSGISYSFCGASNESVAVYIFGSDSRENVRLAVAAYGYWKEPVETLGGGFWNALVSRISSVRWCLYETIYHLNRNSGFNLQQKEQLLQSSKRSTSSKRSNLRCIKSKSRKRNLFGFRKHIRECERFIRDIIILPLRRWWGQAIDGRRTLDTCRRRWVSILDACGLQKKWNNKVNVIWILRRELDLYWGNTRNKTYLSHEGWCEA